ncbi:MAG: ATP-binding cassette domain-containing protein [bacterium]|nr:ATP-binding cassette domain-containing protein [bacterium]
MSDKNNNQNQTGKPLLEVRNLKKYFPITAGLFSRVVGYVKAVDDVSLTVGSGETVGMVGESGCGKTTFGRSILRLIEPTSGEIDFNGESVLDKRGEALRTLRRDMQIIFQDPYSSLNPRKTVLTIVGEALKVHGLCRGKERVERVADLLEKVGLAAEYMNRYPHEFSGGQRQRIGIARAIALNPSFIVCDEPVSALDVSIQAQVINLLLRLREEMNLAYLFIAHDLSVVKHISNRIMVMYLGRMAEFADKDDLFVNPLHPYTRALLSAVPIPDPEIKPNRIVLEGDVPTPINPPSGCYFHPRCPEIIGDICKLEVPPVRNSGNRHQYVCHIDR